MGPQLKPPPRQARDVAEWSSAEVLAFVESALPGHSCTSRFAHASGKVLSSFTKEDLRRHTKDEEAANVIWSELTRWREAYRAISSEEGSSITVYIRTPADVVIELEMLSTNTVDELKTRIASTEGTPVDMQRLTRNGIPLIAERTLACCGVAHGTTLLLVPRLALVGRGDATASRSARNPVSASGIPRPQVPVVCTDIMRPFPMCLEFEGVPQYQAFMLALQRQGGQRSTWTCNMREAPTQQPFLEVLAPDGLRLPVQTRIAFDADAEVLRVDTLGDIVTDMARYRVLLHLHQDQKTAVLVTGACAGR